MPSAYATKLAEAFSAKIMKHVYERSIFEILCNRDYEGEVQQASKVNILTLAKNTELTYSGANLSVQSLTEVASVLTVDQFKSFYIAEKTLDVFKSFIKNPLSQEAYQRAAERKKNVDTFALALWADVGSGNWIGTSYTTGTVTVDVTTGVVTGSGTTFATGMVGKPFKALGHTKWYRIKSYASTTSIVIENDSDDEVSAYDGGAIGAGATYEIQANTVLTLAAANILSTLLTAKRMLDEAEVPDEDRIAVIPPVVEALIPTGTGITMAVPQHYEALTQRGYLTDMAGFKLFRSSRVAGDNTSGYHIICAHKNWLTFADKVLQAGIEEDLTANFGAAYKDLYVYGAKVADVRRPFAVKIFGKV